MKKTPPHKLAARRRGSIAILALLFLVALLATAAFSVDVAYMHLTRAELRRATDAAARAGMEALHRTEDPDAVVDAVQQLAEQNLVAGQPLAVANEQVILGRAEQDQGAWTFVAGEEPFNGVRVIGSRTGDNSVSLFFGRMFATADFEPVIESTVSQDTSTERDFALVVDRSGSMRGSRWQSLLGAVDGFFDALGDTSDEELAGLASYSSRSSLDHRLTDSYSSVESALNQLSCRGMTNIYSGIVDGTKLLTDGSARRDAIKIMVVMTDGKHNTGPEPVHAAEQAANEDIVIYTITFGSNADITRMKAVADTTGGKHYHAPSAAELQEMFEQVVADSAGLVFIE